MRNVISSHGELALAWRDGEPDAHTPSWRTSFNGNVFLSYRTPIARIVANAKGERAILVTTRTYSMTTSSKHMPAVRHAARTSGLPVFNVDFGVVEGLNDNLIGAQILDYIDGAHQLAEQAKRARKYGATILEARERLVTEANAFAAFFGRGKVFHTPDNTPGTATESVDDLTDVFEEVRA